MTLDCNGAESSTPDTLTVSVDGGQAVQLSEVHPASYCITATFDVEADTNTIDAPATSTRPNVNIVLPAGAPGTFDIGDGIGFFADGEGIMYQANSAATVIYLTWDDEVCTSEGSVTINTYASPMSGSYEATLYGYNVISHAVDCGDSITVSGEFSVARSAFTYPDALGDSVCAVGTDEICFIVNGGGDVTYTSGVDGDAFRAVYNTADGETSIETGMTDNITNPDLTLTFGAGKKGTYRFSAGNGDVMQTVGVAGPPPNIGSFYLANDDSEDDPTNDCGTSSITVTNYGAVGGRVTGRFVAELFDYDFDGSNGGGPHTLYCDTGHRRVIYGQFNVERGADSSGS